MKTAEAFGQNVSVSGLPGGSNLVGTIQTVVSTFLVLVGIAAAIYIIISGLKYITSAGDEKKAEEGKNGIIYGVIGLIVVGLAAVIVNFVLSAF